MKVVDLDFELRRLGLLRRIILWWKRRIMFLELRIFSRRIFPTFCPRWIFRLWGSRFPKAWV